MKYILLVNLIGDTNVNDIYYKFGQSLVIINMHKTYNNILLWIKAYMTSSGTYSFASSFSA